MIRDRLLALGRAPFLLRGLGGGVGLLALWGLTIVGLETLGRSYQGYLSEAVGLAVLGVMLGVTAQWHGQRPFILITVTLAELREALAPIAQFVRSLGVDFREQPAFSPGLPPVLTRGIGIALSLLLLSGVFAAWLPEPALLGLRSVSFVFYLLAVSLLWTALIGLGLVLVFLMVAVIHDEFIGRFLGQGARNTRREVAVQLCAGTLLLLAAFLLPAWVALGTLLCLFSLGLIAICWPAGPGATLIWSSGHKSPAVHRFDYRWISASELILVNAVSLSLYLMSSGSQIISADSESGMPVTSWLGRGFGWAAVGGISAEVYILMRFLLRGRKQDPGRSCKPVLRVAGSSSPSQERYIREPLEAAGWELRFDSEDSSATDVRVVLSESQPEASELDGLQARPWPRSVHPSQFESPDFQHQLRRRDAVQKRRLLMRGLERLFKRAARRKFKRGAGFWLGLQFWYVVGMSRDVDEEQIDFEEGAFVLGIIGPPFSRMFSRQVRSHYAEIMRALELDLVFVEDGVGFRGLQKMLRILFEIYDMHDGRQRAEERHFVGVQGIRVIIHDISPEREFVSEVYPEPDYKEVGRGRILHIFKDREDDLERVIPNLDLTNLPVPVFGR
ncbi:MAG: hypothetical protein ACYTG5_11990 [Planctomycetota bacterium]|jgi:hypothetical protein